MAAAAASAPVQMSTQAAARTTLYVCDLPLQMEDIENALYRHFGQAGSIVSTKACRDMHTQRLLGHGYVNFQNPNDAEKALKTLNFSEIVPGKPIRVSWSQRDPAVRKMGTGNVFVRDLDASVTAKTLFDAFTAIGPIASCKLSVDDDGTSRGYGFVHFESPATAEKCIEMSNNDQLLVGGKVIKVDAFKKRADRDKEALSTFVNIYIKNLGPDVKIEQIKKLCVECEGGVALEQEPYLHLQAPFDTQFALVQMNTHEGALKMIAALHEKEGHPFAGKDNAAKLYCARAQTKKERAAAKTLANQQALLQNQGKNLYVKHLDDAMSDEMLHQLFAPFGTIASSSIARFPESGASKGYGFVVFEQKEAAANAQRELHSKVIGTRPLYVAVAQNRDARIKMLEQQSRNRVQAAAMGGAGPMGGVGPMGMGGPGPMGMYAMGGPGAYGPPGAWPQGPAGYGPMRGPMGAMPRGMPGMPNPMLGNLPRPPMGRMGPGGPNGMPSGMGGPRPMMAGPPHGGFPMGPFGGLGMMGGAPNRGPGGPNRGPNPNANRGGGGGGHGGGHGGAGGHGGSLNAQDLSKMSPEEQKNTLGERLFVQVQSIHQPQAAKITGMLLEMDVSEIIHILDNESVLRAKVNEALAVLRDYGVATSAN